MIVTSSEGQQSYKTCPVGTIGTVVRLVHRNVVIKVEDSHDRYIVPMTSCERVKHSGGEDK